MLDITSDQQLLELEDLSRQLDVLQYFFLSLEFHVKAKQIKLTP